MFARVIGNPTPEITWFRNNEPLKPSSKIKPSFDGENVELIITNVNSEEDTGDYKVLAKNTGGKASHGAKVNVEVDSVRFTKELQTTYEVTENETLTMECETSHTVTTQWWHNDKEISGMDHHVVVQDGKKHKLVIKKTSVTDTGSYKCTVKDKKTTTTVTVKDAKPAFIRRLQDLEVKEKEDTVLEVEITSDRAEVQWYKETTIIKETDERYTFEKIRGIRRLIIKKTTVHDEGEYSCKLVEETSSCEVTVIELPPEIIGSLKDQTVNKGEKAMFEIELTKGDALVRWFKDGKEIQFSEHIQLSIDGKQQKLKIYNCDIDDQATYACEVSKHIFL